MHLSRWKSVVATVCAAVGIILSGCGGDGGAPAARTTISGRICDATDTSEPISGAHVYATAAGTAQADTANSSALAEDWTDDDGRYELRGSFPDTVQLRVDAVGEFTGFSVDINVSGRGTIGVQITLVPNTIAVEDVQVEPPDPGTIGHRQTQQFKATVLDAGGDPIENVTPTWAVSGNIGTITEKGVFKAGTRSGSGQVIAVAGGKQCVVDVAVGPVTAYDLSEYWPMAVGDRFIGHDKVSDSMLVLDVIGTANVDGGTCLKTTRPGGGYQYYAWRADGLVMPRWEDAQGWTQADAPGSAFLLPRSMQVGASRTYNSTQVWHGYAGGSLAIDVKNEVTLLGVEDIAGPDGTLRDCLKIRRVREGSYAGGSSRDEEVWWLARGLGRVKAQGSHTETGQASRAWDVEPVGAVVGSRKYGTTDLLYDAALEGFGSAGRTLTFNASFHYSDSRGTDFTETATSTSSVERVHDATSVPGHICTVVKYVDATAQPANVEYHYFERVNDAIYRIAHQDEGEGIYVLPTPQPWLQGFAEVGNSWTYSTDSEGIPGTAHVEVEAVSGQVTVPAGTFDIYARVRYAESGSSGGRSYSYETTYWWAKDAAGQVKDEAHLEVIESADYSYGYDWRQELAGVTDVVTPKRR